MAIKSISFEEDLLESLTDPDEAAAYLAAAYRDSKGLFLEALRDVAKAHKMAKVAEEASVERASLYRMLSAQGNPNFDNISSILDVMGLTFDIVPKEKREHRYTENPVGDHQGNTADSSNTSVDFGAIGSQSISDRCLNALVSQMAQLGEPVGKSENPFAQTYQYPSQQSGNSRSTYDN